MVRVAEKPTKVKVLLLTQKSTLSKNRSRMKYFHLTKSRKVVKVNNESRK